MPNNYCRMALRTKGVLEVALVLLLVWGTCHGQVVVTGTLSGTVTDASGRVVPDATVVVTNVSTGIETASATDATGNYLLPPLSPATYNVLVKKPGFKSEVLTGITLLVNQKARVDVTIQVGDVGTTIEVKAAAPLVNTETASVGTVIGRQQVEDLPLNLRRYGALAALVPGTVVSTTAPGQVASVSGSTFSEGVVNVNGTRSANNNYIIDGIDSKNYQFGGFGLQPPPDAVEEFKIQTNIYDAAFGIAAGATMNVVTKSGTNEVHGAVYEFLRNDKLDARNFFASDRGTLRRNQFGFAVGGPIRRNKTFFFGNYEPLRQVEGQLSLSIVPTDAQKRGDFSSALTGRTINLCGAGGPSTLNFDSGQLFDPATESTFTCPGGSAYAGSNVLVGSPIPGNKLPTIDPVAQKFLSFFPPSNLPGLPNFRRTDPAGRFDDQFHVRIDHTISSRDQLFGRYSFGQTLIAPLTCVSPLKPFDCQATYRGQNTGIGWTHTFGPHLVNEAQVGFQREVNVTQCRDCPRPKGTLAALGINKLVGLGDPYEGLPWISFSNFANLGDSPYTPLRLPNMQEQYRDHLIWNHGRHNVAVGTDMHFVQILRLSAPYAGYGRIGYDGRFSSLAATIPDVATVSDFADFLLGYPNNAGRSVGAGSLYYVGLGYWNFYGQDDFKITRNLTMNIGLRYEYRRPPRDKRYNLVQLVPLGPRFSGPGNAILVTPAPDAQNDAYCTDPFYSFLKTADGRCMVASSALRRQLGFAGNQRLAFAEKKNFAPRLGIAWRPLDSNKLIIRTGAGLFLDSPIGNIFLFGYNSPIFSPTQLYNTAFGAPPPLTNGLPTTVENTFLNVTTPNITDQALNLPVDPHFKNGNVYEWSFGLESQLAQDWALEVNYIGNKGTHLDTLHFFGNQPMPGVGPLQSRRPYPDFNSILYATSESNSFYHALQTKLTKRFSAGYTLLASYTYGKAISDDEGDSDFAGGNHVQDDNNHRGSRGITANDVRNRLALSYIWELPVGSGKRFLNRRGAVNGILGGWQVTGIASFQSGFPFSVFSGHDFSNTGSFYQKADRLCDGRKSNRTLSQWFDTSCFSVAGLIASVSAGQPRFGNSGRDILIGPGLQNLDFGLHKNIGLTERFKLQVRADFFNLFNHPNFGFPDGGARNATFGQVLSAGDARTIQFGLKVLF